MPNTIFVINPNSNEQVTSGIDAALAPLRVSGGPTISCLTLKDGPVGVQCQRDIDLLIAPLLELVRQHEQEAAAFVIACFSDPGLYSVREACRHPVLGIAECGVLAALMQGHRFGVISILEASIPRHLRYFGAMGVLDRCAADRAINMNVSELSEAERTLSKMIETGRHLRDHDGADVIIMGCAGMAAYRRPLEDALGIAVIEPTQAAAAMAMGRVLLGT